MANVTDTTVRGYLDAVASPTPVPGGGGVAALAGALGCALGCMVGSLMRGKPSAAAHEDELTAALTRLGELRARLLELSDADAEGFRPVAAALKLPRSTPAQARERARAIDDSAERACDAPFAAMGCALDALDALRPLARLGGRLIVADAGAAASLARTAADGAALTVHANANMLSDEMRARTLRERADQLMGLAEVRSREVYVTAKLRLS